MPQAEDEERLWREAGRVRALSGAGFLTYLCDDMIHYATHHLSMKNGIGLWLKQYHMGHHYKDDHVGYGVSSPLWDYVFRTRSRETSDAETAVAPPGR